MGYSTVHYTLYIIKHFLNDSTTFSWLRPYLPPIYIHIYIHIYSFIKLYKGWWYSQNYCTETLSLYLFKETDKHIYLHERDDLVSNWWHQVLYGPRKHTFQLVCMVNECDITVFIVSSERKWLIIACIFESFGVKAIFRLLSNLYLDLWGRCNCGVLT